MINIIVKNWVPLKSSQWELQFLLIKFLFSLSCKNLLSVEHFWGFILKVYVLCNSFFNINTSEITTNDLHIRYQIFWLALCCSYNRIACIALLGPRLSIGFRSQWYFGSIYAICPLSWKNISTLDFLFLKSGSSFFQNKTKAFRIAFRSHWKELFPAPPIVH